MKATKDINSCAGIQNNPENVLKYFDTKQPELIEKRLFRLGVGNDSRCKKPVTHRGGPIAVVKNLLLPFIKTCNLKVKEEPHCESSL